VTTSKKGYKKRKRRKTTRNEFPQSNGSKENIRKIKQSRRERRGEGWLKYGIEISDLYPY
jgi:hypothetical protein